MCEIIVQSRVHVDQPLKKESQRTNPKFNLVLKEVGFVRDQLGEMWSAAQARSVPPLKRPITLDIFWQDLTRQPPPKILLERWELRYNWLGGGGSHRRPRSHSHHQPSDPYGSRSGSHSGSSVGTSGSGPNFGSGSVLAQLRRVYRKITAVLRTLYSCTRMLPAYQLSRRAYSMTPNSSEALGVLLYCAEDGMRQESRDMLTFDQQINGDDAVIETRINSISTPYGDFTLNLQYRQNVDFQVARPQELIGSNLIIQDYASNPRKTDSLSSQSNYGGPSKSRWCGDSDSQRIRSYSVHDAPVRAGHHPGGRLMTRPVGIPGANVDPSNTGFPGPISSAAIPDPDPSMFWSPQSDINQPVFQEITGLSPVQIQALGKQSPPEHPDLHRVYSRSADSYSPLKHLMGSPQQYSKSQNYNWSAVPYGTEAKSRYYYQNRNADEVGSLESPLSRKSSLDRKTSFDSSSYGERRKSSHGPFESSGDEGSLPPATPPFTYTIAHAGMLQNSSFTKPVPSSSPPFISIPVHLMGTSTQYPEPPPLSLRKPQIQNHSKSPEITGLALIPLPDSPFQSLDHSSLLQNSVFKDTCGVSHMTTSSSVQETQDSQKQDTQSQDLPFSTSDSIEDLNVVASAPPQFQSQQLNSASLQQLLQICDSFEGQEFLDTRISLESLETELAEFQQHYHDNFKKVSSS